VGTRFSAPVHTDPGAHPASYTMGTESLSRRNSDRVVALSNPSSAEVKERVELYLYTPCGTSWTVIKLKLTYEDHVGKTDRRLSPRITNRYDKVTPLDNMGMKSEHLEISEYLQEEEDDERRKNKNKKENDKKCLHYAPHFFFFFVSLSLCFSQVSVGAVNYPLL
jgi:hypothetical protein